MKQISTIGYEGIDIDGFIATLKFHEISTLVDVRAVALSRKKGFSKTALRERLAKEGISYLHFSALGDPKPGREAARAGQMEQFRRIYMDHLEGDGARQAMKELADRSTTENCCLLCFERDPAVCHRTIVAEKLKTFGFKARDLFGHSAGTNERKSSNLPSNHPHQGATAAQ